MKTRRTIEPTEAAGSERTNQAREQVERTKAVLVFDRDALMDKSNDWPSVLKNLPRPNTDKTQCAKEEDLDETLDRALKHF